MSEIERTHFKRLRDELVGRLSAGGRNVYEFEHGGFLGSMVSCGVDQAHLHVVPLDFDLVKNVEFSEFAWSAAPRIECLDESATLGREYLFVQSAKRSLIAFPEHTTSQWFRRQIANACGEPEWDYKKKPAVGQMKKTAAAIARAQSMSTIEQI